MTPTTNPLILGDPGRIWKVGRTRPCFQIQSCFHHFAINFPELIDERSRNSSVASLKLITAPFDSECFYFRTPFSPTQGRSSISGRRHSPVGTLMQAFRRRRVRRRRICLWGIVSPANLTQNTLKKSPPWIGHWASNRLVKSIYEAYPNMKANKPFFQRLIVTRIVGVPVLRLCRHRCEWHHRHQQMTVP